MNSAHCRQPRMCFFQCQEWREWEVEAELDEANARLDLIFLIFGEWNWLIWIPICELLLIFEKVARENNPDHFYSWVVTITLKTKIIFQIFIFGLANVSFRGCTTGKYCICVCVLKIFVYTYIDTYWLFGYVGRSLTWRTWWVVIHQYSEIVKRKIPCRMRHQTHVTNSKFQSTNRHDRA